MAATISGTALSTIFFDSSNCKSDQEGFLLGQVVNHVTDEISDSQIDNVREETSIQIYGHLPCSSLFSFYDNRGRIQHERLKIVLKDKYKDVIGWYKWRKNSSLAVSMRERMIHRGLMETVSPAVSHHMLFCLCVGGASSNMATHSFDHVFMKFNGRSFQPVSVSIANLGSSSPSDYKMKKSSAVSSDASLYRDVLSQYRRDSANSASESMFIGGLDVLKINNLLQQKLSELCIGVVNSGKQLSDLQDELKTLRQKWKNCQRLEAEREMSAERVVDRSKSSEPLQANPPPRPPKGLKSMSLERGKSLQSSSSVTPAEVSDQSLILDLEEPPHRLVPKSPNPTRRHIDLDEIVTKSNAAKTVNSTNPFASDISEKMKVPSKNTNPFLSLHSDITVDSVNKSDLKPPDSSKRLDLLDSVELWENETSLPPPLITKDTKREATVSNADQVMQVDDDPVPKESKSEPSVVESAHGQFSANNPFSFIDDVLQKAQPGAKDSNRQHKHTTLPRNAKLAQTADVADSKASAKTKSGNASESVVRTTRTRASRSNLSTSQEDIAESKGQRSRRQRPSATGNTKSDNGPMEPSQRREDDCRMSSSPTF